MMIRTFGPTYQTHLEEHIERPLPYTDRHQLKGVAAIVLAIVAKETVAQAEIPAHARQSGSPAQTLFALDP